MVCKGKNQQVQVLSTRVLTNKAAVFSVCDLPFKEICTESPCCSLLLGSHKACQFAGVGRQQVERLIMKTLVVCSLVWNRDTRQRFYHYWYWYWCLNLVVETGSGYQASPFLRGVFIVKGL